MKYQSAINSIKKLVAKNKLQEAVSKIYSLSYKVEDVFECICGKLESGEMIKEYISNGIDSISQSEGEINDKESLNNKTYYSILWFDDEILVFHLEKYILYDIIGEIEEVLYFSFIDDVKKSENIIIKFLNKNIEILKDELSDRYKNINKLFKNKFGLDLEEYINWAYDTDKENIISIVE